MKKTYLLPKESETTTSIYQGNDQTSQLKEICGWGHS